MEKKIICMLAIFGLLATSTMTLGMPKEITTEWEAEITIHESGGRHDYVIIGEKPDASEMRDLYDVPKCPSPPTPYIRAWIYHEGMPYPFETLWIEYRDSTVKVEKEWILRCFCSVSSPTEITITWDKKDFRRSGYDNVILYGPDKEPLADMMKTNHYTYESEESSYNSFTIKMGFDPPVIHKLRYTPHLKRIELKQ